MLPEHRKEAQPTMSRHPLVMLLMCVALVTALMFPVGQAVFPFVEPVIGAFPFDAIEAVLSATLGFGIYSVLTG
jgi:hypothetical protein